MKRKLFKYSFYLLNMKKLERKTCSTWLQLNLETKNAFLKILEKVDERSSLMLITTFVLRGKVFIRNLEGLPNETTSNRFDIIFNITKTLSKIRYQKNAFREYKVFLGERVIHYVLSSIEFMQNTFVKKVTGFPSIWLPKLTWRTSFR